MISAEKFSIFVFLSTVLIIQSYTIGNAWAETDSEIVIPDWIKSTAGWWAEGLVTDKEFVDGIEFMVKNEFIKSPTTSVVEGSATEQTQNMDVVIPDWIKNNAGWWAAGNIGDSDFVSGIEFMVKNEFISSPNISIVEESELIQVEVIEENESENQETQEEVKETFIPPTPKELPHKEPEQLQTGQVQVLIIDGKSFPLEQFWSSETSKCNYEIVWRTDSGKAFDIDGQSIDEGTDGCRFGITAEIEEGVADMTQEQIQNFEELIGIKIT